MAAIHERQGATREGLRLLDSAISAAPRVPYARATRSLFRSQTGDTQGAIADAEFALSLDRNYPIPALGALARALWLAGDTAQAIARVIEAERSLVNPGAPSYTESYWLGVGEVTAGRYRKAAELLRKTKPHGAYLWFLFQSGIFEDFRDIPDVAAMIDAMDPRRPAQ